MTVRVTVSGADGPARAGRDLQLIRAVGPVGQPEPRDGHTVFAGRQAGQLHATARGRALDPSARP